MSDSARQMIGSTSSGLPVSDTTRNCIISFTLGADYPLLEHEYGRVVKLQVEDEHALIGMLSDRGLLQEGAWTMFRIGQGEVTVGYIHE